MTTGRINQVFTSLLTPMCNTVLTEVQQQNPKESEPYGSHFPRQGSRFSFTDCTQSTTQLLNSPAVKQLDCYSQGFYPHPGLPGKEPLPILTGTGWIGHWLKISKKTSGPPSLDTHNSDFLFRSHVGPGVKPKNDKIEIEIGCTSPKLY